ncbi:SDR family NAD(P)-dependent oxidoreductase [Modestobacter excelsi]|uniref:SDR family NAD(P)-dependent oxidoreductase n=1 Tax=Modestobacter excelsi TaxID=2213161 RepID=UPI001C20D242|nr:SDR family NAD(P)-dependent oxidoreductase [Modestobacter excelsi]
MSDDLEEVPVARTTAGLPDLGGTAAVVTGAAGGIGRGIARRLSAAGADVVLHHRTGGPAAEDLARELRAAGGRAVTGQADITDPAACAQLVDVAVREFGRLDVLVNNAGVQPVQPLDGMSVDDWRAVVDVNLTGTFACTQAAVAAMRASGGSIVHIASIEGGQPAFSHAHYSASKAAVRMHARAAALEYGPLGIRVNSVSPGLIDRPGLDEAWPEGVQRWRTAAPLRRLGRPSDVGDACVFLASPMARWITGQDLVVDGGVSAHPTW